jgi:hypothetical protein
MFIFPEPSPNEKNLRIMYGSSISFDRKEDGRVRIERLFVDDSDGHEEDEFEEQPWQSASLPEKHYSSAKEVQPHFLRYGH